METNKNGKIKEKKKDISSSELHFEFNLIIFTFQI
jgi:hypothetical protein